MSPTLSVGEGSRNGLVVWHAMGDMERVASCGRHMARDKQMGGAQ